MCNSSLVHPLFAFTPEWRPVRQGPFLQTDVHLSPKRSAGLIHHCGHPRKNKYTFSVPWEMVLWRWESLRLLWHNLQSSPNLDDSKLWQEAAEGVWKQKSWCFSPSVATNKALRGRPTWVFLPAPHCPAACPWESCVSSYVSHACLICKMGMTHRLHGYCENQMKFCI